MQRLPRPKPLVATLGLLLATAPLAACGGSAPSPTPSVAPLTFSQAKKQYHDTVQRITTAIDTIHPGITWETNKARGASGCEEPKFVSFSQGTAANAVVPDEQRDKIVSSVNELVAHEGYGNHATIANTPNDRYEAWYGKYDQELSVQFSPKVLIVSISGGCFPDPEGAAFTNGPTVSTAK